MFVNLQHDKHNNEFTGRLAYPYQHAQCLLNLQVPVQKTFPSWCWRYGVKEITDVWLISYSLKRPQLHTDPAATNSWLWLLGFLHCSTISILCDIVLFISMKSNFWICSCSFFNLSFRLICKVSHLRCCFKGWLQGFSLESPICSHSYKR